MANEVAESTAKPESTPAIKNPADIKPAAAKPLEAIRLLKPHTHAGIDYPEGQVLVLADVDMTAASAQWLIGEQIAEPYTKGV
jgi:hypothetical protein